MRRAVISRRRSTGLLSDVCTCRTATPHPAQKFDYKLRWFERLIAHASGLLALEQPVVLAGDYNVMRRIWMSTPPSGGLTTRCSGRRCATPSIALPHKAGPMPCARFTRVSGSIRSGNFFGTLMRGTQDYGSITCCSARRSPAVSLRRKSTARFALGEDERSRARLGRACGREEEEGR